MDPLLNESHRSMVREFLRKHRIGLLTLLFTDIVGSTGLKQVLGDAAAVMQIKQHHQLLRELLGEFREAEEISTAGDSFFIVFARPSDALRFALRLQSKLREWSRELPVPVLDRIGLHVGEVVIDETGLGDGGKDLYGMQVDNCARLMSLGEGDQILMSRVVFDNARQVLRGQDLQGLGELSWLNHGIYVMKGIEEPIEVCEVGELGKAVLLEPKDSEKARRHATGAGELVPGWRPALGQMPPGSRWVLEEKLGEGAFGEVWLARHETLKDQRVLKFCFRADRVRSLKREATIFRLLRERAGNHPGIVTVHDLYLDEPPYYLVMDYVPGRDLKSWCARQGGLSAIPMGVRLSLLADVAEALQAAHEAGIIHRDIKPTNVLVAENPLPAVAASNRGSFNIPFLSPRGTSGERTEERGNHERRTSSPQPSPPSDGREGESQDLEAGPASNRSGQPPKAESKASQPAASAKLTDFGIGQVTTDEALAGLTNLGFTQTLMSPSSSGLAGTQAYMAPEVLAGKPATTRSDIYSLGVLLYQVIVGDWDRHLTMDWPSDIEDALLREDLARCFAGDVQKRFAGPGQLANNLRTLPERRSALQQQQARLAALEKAAYRRGVVRAAGLAAVIIALVAGLAIFALRQSRKANAAAQRAEKGETDARRLLYVASMNLAQQAGEQNSIHRLRQLLHETEQFPDRGFEWYYWQRQTHLALTTLRGHAKDVYGVAFSGDGQRIVTGSDDQTAKVWDAATGRELLTLNGHTSGIGSVAFSPDGKRIVTASDRTAKVWDAATGREVVTFNGHSNGIASVVFSSDGQRVVTSESALGAIEDQPGTAMVWEAATGRELLTLKGGRGRVISCAAFSPDGQRIVTGGFVDPTVKVWDAATGSELLTLTGHSSWVRSVAFSPDGRRIVTGSFDRTAKVWDAATGWELFSLKGHANEAIVSVAFSPDGRRISTASQTFDGTKTATVKVWEAVSGRELLSLTLRGSGISSMAFSPDGRRIVTNSDDQTAKVWDAAASRELVTLAGHSSSVVSVACSPDGQRIVTASADQTAKVWDAASGQELLALKHSQSVLSAAFSPDGRRIVTGSGRTARVWDAVTGLELLKLKGHSDDIATAAFSPDGRHIVTGSRDNTAKVWDAASGRELLTFDGNGIASSSVAFSPDGQRIVIVGRAAKVYEAITGRELLTISGQDEGFSCVAFSPDGQRIVTGIFDSSLFLKDHATTAKVWDLATGRELLTLKGHDGPISSVAFSPDGLRIVTGSEDQTAKVWEVATGRELLTLKGHSNEIYSVAFSPDGKRIVTGGNDYTAKVWEAATPEQVAGWQKEEKTPTEHLEHHRREQSTSPKR